LLDHQFDECGLTFSDLAKIEDAIVAKLNAIYHARVSYPTTDAEPEPDAEVRQAEIDAEASA
jgi:hypothetical protein